ncbi:unnamed protein product [Rhizophagus irregularis]|nr:unnamed protein product [Rhizophagus irregularis]
MQHFPQFPTIFQENGEFAFFEFWTMVPLRPVVVLTSSDSFFFNWIENELNISYATLYVIGDLSKEEAEEYFEKHILPYYGMSLLNLSIYTYCGSYFTETLNF